MRPAIAFAALAFLLASCSSAEEEGTPDSPAELSASDILDRVVEAASHLGSIQEERSSTSITHEMPPFIDIPEGADIEGSLELPQGSTSRTLRIQVGDDSYTRSSPEPPAGFCDEQPEACRDGPSFMDEQLLYRGKSYLRNPETGNWVKWPEPGECLNLSSGFSCSGAATYLEAESIFESGECPAAEHWFGSDIVPDAAEQAANSLYNFAFILAGETEHLGDEISDGVSLVHIRGTLNFDFPDPYDPPEELLAIYEECGIEVPTPDPEFDRMRIWMPDRNEGEFEMWIDQDFHVRRLTFEGRSYNGDRLIQTDREEATYSLFNEAKLPGPLPD